MRIYLKLSYNKYPVPFTYQEQLTATLHKWLKDSSVHEGVSLYSFSQLMNGKMENRALNFNNGSAFFISCWDVNMIRRLIRAIKEDPELGFGMYVREVVIKENPDLTKIEYFRIASPILIHRKKENKHLYYYYDDEDSGRMLTNTIKTKMSAANLESDDSLSIEFDRSYKGASKKRVNYKGISNPVSICPVIIKGSNLSKQFIWNVGLGNSTGIGFGAIF